MEQKANLAIGGQNMRLIRLTLKDGLVTVSVNMDAILYLVAAPDGTHIIFGQASEDREAILVTETLDEIDNRLREGQ
jgi:DNA-binding LytR/AlgR family response regulator